MVVPPSRAEASLVGRPRVGLLLKRALDRASVWHRDQVRKYPGVRVPYVSHIAGVVAILARHGFDEEVQAAGALHDVIEDCGVTKAELEELFGPRVASLVDHVTEQDRSLSWEDRKRLYVEHFAHKPWEAQAISLADKIDNFESILVCAKSFGNPWPMFKRGKDTQLGRFDDLAEKLASTPHHPIIDEFKTTLELVRAVEES
jgi:(p)ppGpp synthase/HD superfamily hydrolase